MLVIDDVIREIHSNFNYKQTCFQSFFCRTCQSNTTCIRRNMSRSNPHAYRNLLYHLDDVTIESIKNSFKHNVSRLKQYGTRHWGHFTPISHHRRMQNDIRNGSKHNNNYNENFIQFFCTLTTVNLTFKGNLQLATWHIVIYKWRLK